MGIRFAFHNFHVFFFYFFAVHFSPLFLFLFFVYSVLLPMTNRTQQRTHAPVHSIDFLFIRCHFYRISPLSAFVFDLISVFTNASSILGSKWSQWTERERAQKRKKCPSKGFSCVEFICTMHVIHHVRVFISHKFFNVFCRFSSLPARPFFIWIQIRSAFGVCVTSERSAKHRSNRKTNNVKRTWQRKVKRNKNRKSMQFTFEKLMLAQRQIRANWCGQLKWSDKNIVESFAQRAKSFFCVPCSSSGCHFISFCSELPWGESKRRFNSDHFCILCLVGHSSVHVSWFLCRRMSFLV